MLAKIWKKVLLAICIVACIYNVMSKIVNRNSLETNLKSANDGNTIWQAVKDTNTTSNTNEEAYNDKDSSSNTMYNEIESEKTDENRKNSNRYSDYRIVTDEE